MSASLFDLRKRLVRVALPVPLGRVFTYRVPDGFVVLPGMRVLVPFGRRPVIGIVTEVDAEVPKGFDENRLKDLHRVLDETPTLAPELLAFLQELARYYLAPLGEVLRLALPVLERSAADEIEKTVGKKWKSVGRLVRVARLLPEAERAPDAALPQKGHARSIVERLEREGPCEVVELARAFSTARSVVARLEKAGIVQTFAEERESDPFFAEPAARDAPPRLNPGQSSAVERLRAGLDAPNGAAFLLDGVTASGKTEVYLHAAAEALARGRGVILLVPEIALTPQLVGRFRARLGDEIAVLHSGLGEPARLAMWRNLRSGRLRVAIGARSALFAPVQNLGLVCVDEEHDPSYKQEEGVRYNARDMALLRAKRSNAVVVLGSATPSLASEASVRRGQLARLVLRERAHATASLPSVETIDLTRMGPGPSGDPLLSVPLDRALEANLREGGQSILFLNRRGFAPSLICQDCGTIENCPSCSVALTLHRAGGARLECHYCDHRARVPESCSACGSKKLGEEGLGTERVESLLAERFPEARIARLDRDVASGTKSEKILDRMRKREIDILVGTQMVTKGHDLPEVTLVGVLNADAALSLPDFRAAERTFHQLVQVSGRAGRADRPGRVLIQTRNPAHPAIACALTHDVARFVESELALREDVGYPPFVHLALVRLDGLDETAVRHEAARLARVASSSDAHVEILGPTPAPLGRLRSRYRHRFLVRASERAPLRRALLSVLRALGASRSVRVGVDVDPQSLL